jgi:2-oxo-4-hydroxy-4-carboxy-5-ureidoimidazoline decarboxylase
MTVAELNALSSRASGEAFSACLGSPRWVLRMVTSRPFKSHAALVEAAESSWRELSLDEWKEAIAHHPRIGESKGGKAAKERSASWSAAEQSGARRADAAMTTAIAVSNAAYERRFGHRFIISAADKSASEILDALRARLPHDPSDELLVTADELRKIAMLRLAKLVPDS